MKKAFAIGVLLLGFAAVPAKASEFGLLLDKEIGRAEAFHGSGLQNGQLRRVSPDVGSGRPTPSWRRT